MTCVCSSQCYNNKLYNTTIDNNKLYNTTIDNNKLSKTR